MRSTTDDLPEPQPTAWSDYIDSEQGERAAMRSALDRFIRSMDDLTVPLRDDRARGTAERVADGHERIPIRQPLFREIILPALIQGLESGQPGCARWLADLASQLTKVPTDLVDLPDGLRTRAGLLRRALSDDPDDRRAARLLVEVLADQLSYSIHEAPAGVLWDDRGATAEQVAELQHDLEEFRGLLSSAGSADEYAELVRGCAEFHSTEYRRHLGDPRRTSDADHLEAVRGASHRPSIASFRIDDDPARAGNGSIEVGVVLSDGTTRWCFFITPEALAAAGGWLPGRTDVRIHLGVRHMIVVSTIDESVIEATLRMLEEQGILDEHNIGLP